MLKKILKRYLPQKEHIHQHRILRIFGKLLHDGHLWHLNRRTVPRAVAIGLFCAFLPIPFQMALACALAIVLRANIPIAMFLVWLTNPITIPPIFYSCYKVGAFLMQLPAQSFTINLSFAWLSHSLGIIWQPLLLGSVVCGLIASVVGYAFVTLLWRWQLRRAWLRRTRKK